MPVPERTGSILLLVIYRILDYSRDMREPTYFILLSLLRGPVHGYGIAKRVEELSERRVHLAAGTLYGALDRLTDQGLVTIDGEELVNGRRRRYYSISDTGRNDLLAEVSRMRASVAAAETLTGAISAAVVK